MKHRKTEGRYSSIRLWSALAVTLLSALLWKMRSVQFFAPTNTYTSTATSLRISALRLNPSQTQTPNTATIPSLTATPTPFPLRTIRVISYNVLFGAGVDRQYDDLLPAELRNKMRLPEFLTFVDQIRPDILGVQEANGWDGNTPPVVQEIAEQLDMNYFLAAAPSNFNVVLFTKFEILETENLSGKEDDPVFETMRALRAVLMTPDNQPLNVFVVHLDPFSASIRLTQLYTLIDEMEPYQEQKTILLGDMNFCVGSTEYLSLERAGWQPVAVASYVDQIWVSPIASLSGKPMLIPFRILPWSLSDHLPVGAEIRVYQSQAVSLTSTPSQQLDRFLSEDDC